MRSSSRKNLPLRDLVTAFETGRRPVGGLTDANSVGVPSLGGENVTQEGSLTFGELRRVPRPYFEQMSAGVLRRGDVLINKDGAQTGKVAAYSGEFPEATINEHLFLLRPDGRLVDHRFLYWVMQSSGTQRQIARFIAGSAQPGLPRGFAERVLISLPSLDEQRRTADILDSVSASIRSTAEVAEKLKGIKGGLRRDLLTLGITMDGHMRSDSTTKSFKDTPVGRLPTEWDVTSIDEVSRLVTSGSRGWARYYADDGALFIRIGNLTREHINLRVESAIHVRPPGNREGERTRLEEGDVLISITADLGITGVVPRGLEEAYVNQHIALIRIDSSRANPRWVGHYFSGPSAQRAIRRLDDPGAKAGLNLPTLRKFLMPLPPMSEQNEMVDRLDAVDESIQAEVRCMDKLKKLRRGLLQDLLDGRDSHRAAVGATH